VLEGLGLHLRRRYDVVTAPAARPASRSWRATDGGDHHLRHAHAGMDGATFLGKARAALPDAVRLLLTGQAALDAAVAAVNEGQIFRFLTKPCAPNVLLLAVDTAADQHRLITSERVLLEQTLHAA